MKSSKYFFQGFLFIFGLCQVPFLNEVKNQNKIDSYWQKVAEKFNKFFYAEVSKTK